MQTQFSLETLGPTVDAVLSSLRRLRVLNVGLEYSLQDAIAKQFDTDGIPYAKEYVLGPRNRIDFLIPGGIGVEVKKGKPNSVQLQAQAERYCRFDAVQTLVLVVERNVIDYDPVVNGKPVHYVALNKLWGIAL